MITGQNKVVLLCKKGGTAKLSESKRSRASLRIFYRPDLVTSYKNVGIRFRKLKKLMPVQKAFSSSMLTFCALRYAEKVQTGIIQRQYIHLFFISIKAISIFKLRFYGRTIGGRPIFKNKRKYKHN